VLQFVLLIFRALPESDGKYMRHDCDMIAEQIEPMALGKNRPQNAPAGFLRASVLAIRVAAVERAIIISMNAEALKPMRLGHMLANGLRWLTIPLIFFMMWLVPLSAAETLTPEQKINAENVIKALNSRNEAARQSNRLGPPGVAGIIDREKIQPILMNMQAAYNYASGVRDDVLDKINPDLKDHWKNEFIEGLRLRISNLEKSDLQAEFRGSDLLDKFGAWFDKNRTQIRIPK
jgi:hypothetical protein